MTASYKELLAQKASLEKQIEEKRKEELSSGIQQIKTLMADLGITIADITGNASRRSKTAATSIAPKYRDPASGATWTGRGKAPLWIKNAVDRTPFEIK